MTCGMHTEIIVARVGVRRTIPRPLYPNSSSKRRISSSVSGPAVAMWPLCYVPAPTVGPLGAIGGTATGTNATAFQVHTLPSNFGVASSSYHHLQQRTFQTLPASYVISCAGNRGGGAYHDDLRINGCSEIGYHNGGDLGINSSDLRFRVPDFPFIPSLIYAKKDIYQVKSQRLMLAQDEYDHLNNALATLGTSRTSLCSSTSSISTKYDPDLLKSDVALAKSRVSRLKSELEQIRTEMVYTQRGVETLANVEQKLSLHQGGRYTISDAQAIMNEVRNIQKSLSSGEKEKADLMQSLAKLKDDLTRLQLSESSPDASTLSLPQEKLSTASQTDLSCDLVPVGTKLAEMAKMRLEYDEARKKVQNIQQKLADLEEKVQPGQVESDKDRLLLFQEKEQLLRELRSITPRMRSKEEMTDIQMECKRLEQDLNKALEMSNRAIADRLRLHEEKQLLLQQLKSGLRLMTQLESQLKTLSASTLSMSSSSSLGSLSTTSSKGSLSSGLSFTDIYGGPQCAPPPNMDKPIDMADLHRRVERLLKTNDSTQSSPSPVRSQPSLSPRSSLSSVSPPVSPMYENLPCIVPPPAYEQVERDRKAYSELQQKQIEERLLELRLSNPSLCRNDEYIQNLLSQRTTTTITNASPIIDIMDVHISNMSQGSGLGRPDNQLSPISETPPFMDRDEMMRGAALSRTSSSGTNTRSVSAAVSDESVAGDSGVFEASNRKRLSGLYPSEADIETAQVQIKLRYILTENMLNIAIEKARNLNALLIPNNSQFYVKVALLPAIPSVQSVFATKNLKDLKKANFGDNFNICIPASKIFTKTLQINVWNQLEDREKCVGCAQVSLADFNVNSVSTKWYNILCLQEEIPVSVLHPKQESDVSVRDRSEQDLSYKQTGKEESSDDSTIISSQTSTLTRNQDTVFPSAMNLNFEELYNCLKNTEEYDSDDSDEDLEDGEEEEEDQEGITVEFGQNEKLEPVMEHAEHGEDLREYSDAQTNTECNFHPEQAKQMKLQATGGCVVEEKGAIKRSQTFSPSAQVSKSQYVCKLNRSDSDSAMPLYRRGGKPFERHAVERRSLRFRRQSGSMAALSGAKSQSHLPTTARTSIDLELDLQAQHTRLDILNSDLTRLRELKQRLEFAKDKGDSELATYLLEDQQFQNLMAQAESWRTPKTIEEKKVEKMLRKVSREIYKLRKSKAGNGKPDIISFKEKMAFFTRTSSSIPYLPTDECHADSNTLKSSKENGASSNKTTENQRNSDNGDNKSNECPSTEQYTYVIDRVLGVEV